ncbi:MAG: hypothetical protein EA418_06730 [Wenzhouxiangellaceae bacterium]|nr:MAG: hypothetical protein EA418_06730 [Wenzhouxiangellaceae bacterium]
MNVSPTLRLGVIMIACLTLGTTAAAEPNGDTDGNNWPLRTVMATASDSIELRFSDPGATGRWQSTWLDFTGNGHDDLVITLPSASPGGRSEAGLAYIVFGGQIRPGTTLDLDRMQPGQGLRLEGQRPGARLGWSVASAGHFLSQSHADLALGAPGALPGGQVHLVAGRPLDDWLELGRVDFVPGELGPTLSGGRDSAAFGLSLVGIGDFNGNGFHDLAIGDPAASRHGRRAAGSVTVLFGGNRPAQRIAVHQLPTSDALHIHGSHSHQQLGLSLAAAGKFDGDARSDLVIGAGTADRGEVYLVFGHGDVVGHQPVVRFREAPYGHRLAAPVGARGFGNTMAAIGHGTAGRAAAGVLIAAPYSDGPDRLQNGSIYRLLPGMNGSFPKLEQVLTGSTSNQRLGSNMHADGHGGIVLNTRAYSSDHQAAPLVLRSFLGGEPDSAGRQALLGEQLNLAGQTHGGGNQTEPSKTVRVLPAGAFHRTGAQGLIVGPETLSGDSARTLELIRGSGPPVITPPEFPDQIAVPGDSLQISFQVSQDGFPPGVLDVSAFQMTGPDPVFLDIDVNGDDDGNWDINIVVLTDSQSGIASVLVSVFNPQTEDSTTTSFDIAVFDALAPVISTNFFPFQEINAGDFLSLEIEVSDPQFPAEDILVAATPSASTPELGDIQLIGGGASRQLQISTLPGETGLVDIIISALNPLGLSDQTSFQLDIQEPPPNPTISPIPDQIAASGDRLEIDFQVDDASTGPEFVAVSTIVESGSSISPDDVSIEEVSFPEGQYRLVIEIPAAAPIGSALIGIEAFNKFTGGFAFEDFNLDVFLPQQPILNGGQPLPARTVSPGEVLIVDFTIDDPQFDPDALDIEVLSSNPDVILGPVNISGSGTDRQLAIDTLAGSNGLTQILIIIRNPIGRIDSTQFDLDIPLGSQGPLINAGSGIADRSAVAGETLIVPFSISDAADPPSALVVSALSLTPNLLPDAGLSLNGFAENRSLSIQTLAGSSGNAQVLVTVANTSGQTGNAVFAIDIFPGSAEPPPPNGPRINDGQGIPDQQMRAGETIVVDFSVDDEFDPPEAITVDVVSLDEGLLSADDLAISGAGRQRTLVITAPGDALGQATLELTARNSQQLSSTAVFGVEIQAADDPGPPRQPPSINNGNGLPDQTVRAGQILALEFSASDPIDPADALIVSAVAEPELLLPANALNLTRSDEGWLLEIDAPPEIEGLAMITITVTNTAGLSDQASFDLVILPALQRTMLALAASAIEAPDDLGQIIQLDVVNSGAHDAINPIVLVGATGSTTLLDGLRIATDCRFENRSLRCRPEGVSPWQCELLDSDLVCEAASLAAGITAPLVLRFQQGEVPTFIALTEADNADSVELNREQHP